MRDLRRFPTAMQMSAALNVFNRSILEVDGVESIIVTRRDYEGAFAFFQGGSRDDLHRVPRHVCEFFRKVVIPLWDGQRARSEDGQTRLDEEGGSERPLGITTSQMVEEYRDVFKKSISSKTLWNRYLPILEDKGLISPQRDPEDKRRYLYTVQQREICQKKLPFPPFQKRE